MPDQIEEGDEEEEEKEEEKEKRILDGERKPIIDHREPKPEPVLDKVIWKSRKVATGDIQVKGGAGAGVGGGGAGVFCRWMRRRRSRGRRGTVRLPSSWPP